MVLSAVKTKMNKIDAKIDQAVVLLNTLVLRQQQQQQVAGHRMPPSTGVAKVTNSHYDL
jgi:hypothetical protein